MQDLIECPKCGEIALALVAHCEDFDEYICEECGHYQTMGRLDDE